MVKTTLDILNFREKGGYSLRKIPCALVHSTATGASRQEADKNNNETVDVLLYIAIEGNHDFVGHETLENLAHHILKAVGPSGPNKDYLFNLAEALTDFGRISDDDKNHTMELRKRVKKLQSI